MSPFVCGLDVHKDSVYATVMIYGGELVEKRRLTNDEVVGFLDQYRIDRVAMESSTSIVPIYRAIKEKGYNVLVSHPKKAKLIAESRIKSDRVDSWALTELARLDALPLSYMPPEDIAALREKVRRVRCFMVDETWIRVGSQEAWLWLAFEPYGRFFLGFYISRNRNILTAELFLQGLIDRYGRHPVHSDGASWYPDACRSLGLEHQVYDAVRGNLMERFVQYVKDRTEGFDDYFPCLKERCSLDHVKGWLNWYMLSFNLFKHSDALDRSPILQLSQLIRGEKDPP